jgi:hypothetical protein
MKLKITPIIKYGLTNKTAAPNNGDKKNAIKLPKNSNVPKAKINIEINGSAP